MPIPDWLRTRPGLIVVLASVAFAAVLLYLPTTRHDFVWDDVSLITENQELARSQPWEFFTRGYWAGAPEPPDGNALTFYRPVTTLSFWFDFSLAGASPGHFHLVNVILNALASVAVVLVAWELLHSGVWAGLAGLLFTAHSSHVESVAFVSGRTDLLLALFVSIAACSLLRSLRTRQPWWRLLTLFCFGLALLSKETAILFPALAALVPFLTQRRYDRSYWLAIGVMVLMTAGYLVLRTAAVGAALPARDLQSLPQRAAGIVNTFGLYVRMFVWPFSHQVKFPIDPSFSRLTRNAIAALLFLVTLPLIAARRRFWVSLLGYAWAILFLLPVSGVVEIGPQAAERLLYLPSAGFVLMVIAILSRLLHARSLLRNVAAAALGLVCIVLAADTMARSKVWRDEPTLFSAMAREAPTAPSAHANLANALRSTDPDSAISLYRRALSLDQEYVRAHINLGILLSQQGDFASALEHLRTADRLRPNSGQVLHNLGLFFLSGGEPESALVCLDRALAIDPAQPAARLARALALARLDSAAAFRREIQGLLADDPEFVPARLALVEQLEQAGQLDSASLHLREVVRLVPDDPGLRNRLGTMLFRLGESRRAQDEYERAIALDSCFVPALFNLAVITAEQGDTVRAVRLARRAARLRPDLTAVADLLSRLERKSAPDSAR